VVLIFIIWASIYVCCWENRLYNHCIADGKKDYECYQLLQAARRR
jgi:hypothetical protein